MHNLTLEEQVNVYLNIGIEPFTRVLSPLRVESRPSFSTYESDGKILWKDFGSGDGGDLISLIMRLEGLDYNGAISFAKSALSGSGKKFSKPISKPLQVGREAFTEDITKDFELNFWAERGICRQQLMEENVFSLKMLMINDKFVATSTENNPKFVYKYSEDSWKIYSPYDQQNKWLSHNILNPFEVGKTGFLDLVILSSKKDRMVFENVGIPVSTISLHSESNFNPLIKELNTSLSKYDRVFSFLDFDSTGLGAMNKIEQKSGGRIKPLKISNDVVNFLVANGIKDVDDFYLKFGNDKLKSFILKIFKENV